MNSCLQCLSHQYEARHIYAYKATTFRNILLLSSSFVRRVYLYKSLSLIPAYTYFQIIMSSRRAVRGRPRRNIEEKEVPNSPYVQPQGNISNVEFCEAIRMLSQLVTNHVRKQQGARQKGADTSRVCEFLRMNPPSFTGSSTTDDPENIVEDLKKVLR